MSDFGVITEAGTVRFERLLPGPIERVWAFLTESDKRAVWLAAGPMDLRAGGAVELSFRNAELSPRPAPAPDKYRHIENGGTVRGRVTRCEPPRLLSFTRDDGGASDSEVTFELQPQADRVFLVLTHRRLTDMLEVASGWHKHLAILADGLAGRTPEPFWSEHGRIENEYRRMLAPGA